MSRYREREKEWGIGVHADTVATCGDRKIVSEGYNAYRITCTHCGLGGDSTLYKSLDAAVMALYKSAVVLDSK